MAGFRERVCYFEVARRTAAMSHESQEGVAPVSRSRFSIGVLNFTLEVKNIHNE